MSNRHNTAPKLNLDEARAEAIRQAEEEDRVTAAKRAEAEADYREALKARIAEALAAHWPLEPREAMIGPEGPLGYEIECHECDHVARTTGRPSAAFAEHQADVVLDLL